jgi:hypothetical protein
MVSLSDADPVVTVTLDPASMEEERGAVAGAHHLPPPHHHHHHHHHPRHHHHHPHHPHHSGDEALVVVHREPDLPTPPSPPAGATSHSQGATAQSLDNASASLDPHGWLGAAVLLGPQGGLRGAEGGSREQIHNRQNARDRAAKAAEGEPGVAVL